MESMGEFSTNAKACLLHAEVLARLCKAKQVETTHILLGLMDIDGCEAYGILGKYNIDVNAIRKRVGLKPGVAISTITNRLGFSAMAKISIEYAVSLAESLRNETCCTIDLLTAILEPELSEARAILLDMGVDVKSIISDCDEIIGKEHDEHHYANANIDNDANPVTRKKVSSLEQYTNNLTQAAKDGKLDPVVGRGREIERLITIISRRTKNNPVLIGEAGVGKTAVVEGLAQRIASRQVPNFLADYQILELDLTSLIAGTKYRGEFEDRMKRLLNEIEQSDKLIIFIDELHTMVGAGASEGSMDVSNILKPALARGKFQLIGATTSDEYRKYIEKDAALARRLQEIIVEEPSAENTKKILTGIAKHYEDYHQVKISPMVIDEIVRLSSRYLTGRQQPDKAIDVLDETAARVRIAAANNDLMTELSACRQEIEKLTAKIDQAVADEDYEQAALCKMRISQIKTRVEELESNITGNGFSTVKLNDVATTVSRMTGVPLEQLQRSEITKLINLEKRLERRIIGQPQAVQAVATAIRRSRAGIGDSRRPIGSFIFLGPTGVGKTELAKVLADEVFGSRDNLIKVDMSEFSERHTVSRLVGSTAGYVGYEDGGQLTEKVRRQPYSVVLFDEIEKAHPDVFNILLQILEDGVLTDGHGKQINFRNTVIILTSNIGANEMAAESVGFAVDGEVTNKTDDSRHEIVMKALRNTMRPELLNRFDQIVLFNELGEAEINQIFNLMIDDLNKRLGHKGITVTVSSRLRRHLLKQGFDPKYGARPLRRAIQDTLERELADQMISGKLKRGSVVKADWQKDTVTLACQKEKSDAKTTVSKAA